MSSAAEREPIIRVEDLVAGYGDRTIFDGVSFEVLRGEVFVILGGSGSGKSTLLKVMIGLLRPWRGKVWIQGRDVTSDDPQERAALLRGIGVMYQQGALFGSMTL